MLDVPFERARGQYPEEGAAPVRGVCDPAGIGVHHCSHLVQHLGDQPQPNQHERRRVGDVSEQPENHRTLMRSPG
jgi:hypothetical protein